MCLVIRLDFEHGTEPGLVVILQDGQAFFSAPQAQIESRYSGEILFPFVTFNMWRKQRGQEDIFILLKSC